MIRLVLISSWMVFLCAVSLGHTPDAFSKKPEYSLQPGLPEDVARTLKKKGLSSQNLSYSVVDLGTGKELRGYRSNAMAIPASVTKVLTAYFALEVFGAKHRFHTDLFSSGVIKDGKLDGVLYLRGGGDPFLTASDLLSLAMHVQAKGIRQVSGGLIYDDQLLPRTDSIDPKGEPDEAYNSGVSALSSEFNRFLLWRMGSSRHTSRSHFATVPQLPSLTVKKTSKAFPPGVRFKGEEKNGVEQWSVARSIRYKRIEELPVRNPSLYTAEIFRRFLGDLGIKVPQVMAGKTPKDGLSLIYSHPSQSVGALSGLTLEYSNNLISELLLLNAARRFFGKAMSLSEAAQGMKKWYEKRFGSPLWKDVRLFNGSGLNSENRVSASAMTTLLKRLYRYENGGTYFSALLPASGWKGSLRKRIHDPDAALRVWGKTGSLDYVSAMSGFVWSQHGRQLAFSIFVNDLKKRSVLDEGSRKKASSLRRGAMKWRLKSQSVIDELVRLWAIEL